jgi:hypothetical protein
MHDQGQSRSYGRRKDRPANMPEGNALGVPAEDAFDTDDDVFDEGKHQFEKAFRIGFDIQVNDHFAFTIQDADIHFSGMQIDTAVILVLLIVEFHGVPPFAWVN